MTTKTMTIVLSVATTTFLASAAGAARAGTGDGDGKALAIGVKAPMADIKMQSATDGKDHSIASAAGAKGTLVVFTCNGCPYARAWEQRIVELAHTYQAKGVGMLLVNSNSPDVSRGDAFAAMQARAKERGMLVPYVVDKGSAVARAFGASVTPEAFLFDKAGKLAYHGTIDDNSNEPDKVSKRYLKDALDAVVAGKAPAAKETKSMGCGIKYPKQS